MKNIEIEVKLKIDGSVFNEIKNLLDREGQVTGEKNQVDEYFTRPDRNFVEPEYPYEWLSLRKRGSKVILNYKHWHPENEPISTHCDELEVELSSFEQGRLILLALGFKSLAIVNKNRRSYAFRNDFEVALDEVDELGCFVEVEYKGKSDSIEQANQSIKNVLVDLGLDGITPDNRGYPYLMLEKNGHLPNK